jgi:hypothetical protein
MLAENILKNLKRSALKLARKVGVKKVVFHGIKE